MYVNASGSLCKSEEQFQKERHASVPMRAERQTVLEKRGDAESAGEKGRRTALSLRERGGFSTEEYLLCGLILWQLFGEKPDYLLIGILLFLLIFA